MFHVKYYEVLSIPVYYLSLLYVFYKYIIVRYKRIIVDNNRQILILIQTDRENDEHRIEWNDNSSSSSQLINFDHQVDQKTMDHIFDQDQPAKRD